MDDLKLRAKPVVLLDRIPGSVLLKHPDWLKYLSYISNAVVVLYRINEDDDCDYMESSSEEESEEETSINEEDMEILEPEEENPITVEEMEHLGPNEIFELNEDPPQN